MEVIRAGSIEVVRVVFEGYAGGGDPPNAYFIPHKPLVIIDTGIAYPGNLDAVSAALAPFGLALSDIEQVVFTHWHWDHTGLAREIADRSKAVFSAHPAERARPTASKDGCRAPLLDPRRVEA